MSPEHVPGSAEERREHGLALAAVGVVLWAFDVLVIFFFPASVKVGYRAVFLIIVIVLALLGLVLVISGSRKRAAV